jgi:SNF2 family DNA or RNA helicase
MIRAELYVRAGRPVVILEREADSESGAWARIQEGFARGVIGGSHTRLDLKADAFFADIHVLREVRSMFGTAVGLGDTLTAQLKSFAADRQRREGSITNDAPVDREGLAKELQTAGFVRQLKPFQLDNLGVILRLPHGADFSVPGAGKTTVALASFAVNRARGIVKRLLVVAPIAAFEAWKVDSEACIAPAPVICVHEGAGSVIPENTDLLLTNYNRLASDYDRIREYVSEIPTQVILDEAHRIKRGAGGVYGQAALDLAYAARRRDVLTGTPAPQGAFDLVALMQFLYPGQDRQILPAMTYMEKEGRDPIVLRDTQNAIAKYFVRTTKSKLDLPDTTFEVIRRPMGPIQKAIYEGLIGKFSSAFAVDTPNRRELSRLGRVVMYLLEAATNPMLIAAGSDPDDDAGFEHPPLPVGDDQSLMDMLQNYALHETPWKYKVVAEIVADAASRHEKILIWSSFVRNIKALQRYLSVYNPAVIHGGVPPEDGAPPNVVTREAELKRFRTDAKCSVLLANPAAAGEGISLHHDCHHAIYLDRSFNAGQFLQSQDRIHRLGLAEGTETRFTLLVSEDTIDDSVDSRLRDKVKALSILMDDPGLVLVSLPDPEDPSAGPPVYSDDMDAVAAHVVGASRAAQ